ncbi:hypothetical protein PspLS_05650 [Pyricularia sp. CBS 133598]|nr:hypothetical protein PspLS_05650 [Pyricularia sp. CBS 133598]
MSSRAKSKSKRSSGKREHSSRSNEAETDYNYEGQLSEHTVQYDGEYSAHDTYGTCADYEGHEHVGEAEMTPRSKHFNDGEPLTPGEYEGITDTGTHEATEALSGLEIDNDTYANCAEGTEARGDQVYDDPYGSTSKGKDKQTADVGYEYDHQGEPAESDTHTKSPKQVTFGETNDYAGQYNETYQREEYEDAVDASQGDYYLQDQVGESSTAAVDPYQDTEVDILALAPKGPKISGTKQPHVTDSRFQIYDSMNFYPGAVFKTLWPEPMGTSSRYTTVVAAEEKGKSVHVSTRRFIIVGNADNQSYCVPIFTYGRQGCKKKGVKPHRHGIIYNGDYPPEPLKNEPELGYEPVRVYMEESQGMLGESRVNYSMICTVQHNIKALFIGFVSQEDLKNVVQPAVFSIMGEARDRPVKSSKERRKGK